MQKGWDNFTTWKAPRAESTGRVVAFVRTARGRGFAEYGQEIFCRSGASGLAQRRMAGVSPDLELMKRVALKYMLDTHGCTCPAQARGRWHAAPKAR